MEMKIDRVIVVVAKSMVAVTSLRVHLYWLGQVRKQTLTRFRIAGGKRFSNVWAG